MSNKNETVSFRIGEETFGDLRSIADDRDPSLSSVFRDYVDAFVDHDGQVEVVPEHADREGTADDDGAFPLDVEIPRSRVREHERIELECEHLREQLSEYKRYAARLEQELAETRGQEAELVRLEEVDFESGTSPMID